MVQAMSLFNQLLQHFPRSEFVARWCGSTVPNGMRRALRAGPSWSRCFSASLRTPIRFGKSAMA